MREQLANVAKGGLCLQDCAGTAVLIGDWRPALKIGLADGVC